MHFAPRPDFFSYTDGTSLFGWELVRWCLTDRLDMPASSDGATRWRALAAETRAVAAEMNDPEARRIMLAIAEAYERLARYAESRKPVKI